MKNVILVFFALLLASSAFAQVNGSCNYSKTMLDGNGNTLTGVVNGPSGLPFLGGDFCGFGGGAQGTKLLTLGALPNMWMQLYTGTVNTTSGASGSCTAGPCAIVASGSGLPFWAVSGTPVQINQGAYLIGTVYSATAFSVTTAFSSSDLGSGKPSSYGSPTCSIAQAQVGQSCYPFDYGATGAGSVAINDAGLPFARGTDRYTCPNPGNKNRQYGGPSYVTAGNATFNSDDSAIYFQQQAGGYGTALFNQTNFVPGTTASPFTVLNSGGTCINFGIPVAPASTDPHKLYAILVTNQATQSGIVQWDWSSCVANPSNCAPTSNLVYDLAAPGNCLANPANGGYAYNDTYDSLLSVDALDTTIHNAISNGQGGIPGTSSGGGQDTGTLAYSITTTGPPSYSLVGGGCRVMNTGYPSMAVTNQAEVALGPHANIGPASTSGSTVTAGTGLTFSSADTWVIELAGIGQAQLNETGSSALCPAAQCMSILSGSPPLPAWAAGSDATAPGTPIEINKGSYLIQHIYSASLQCNGSSAGSCFTLTAALGTGTGNKGDAAACATSCYYSFGSLYNATYASPSTVTVTPIQTMYNGSLTTAPFNGAPGTQAGLTYIAGIPPGYIEGDWGPTGAIAMSGCIASNGQGATGPCQNGPQAFSIHDSNGGFLKTFHVSGAKNICLTPVPYTCSGEEFWNVATLNVWTGNISGHGNSGYYARIHGTGTVQQQFLPLLDAAGDWAPGYNPGTSDFNLTAANMLPTAPAGLGTHASWLWDNPYDTMPIATNAVITIYHQSNNMAENGCDIPFPLWTNAPNCGTDNPMTGPIANEIVLQQAAEVPGSNPWTTQACAVVQCSVPGTCNGVVPPGSPLPTVVGNNGALAGDSTNTCSNADSGNTPMPIVRLGGNYGTTFATNFYSATGYLGTDQIGKYVMFPSDYMCTLGMSPTNNLAGPVCGGPNWFPNNKYLAGNIVSTGSPHYYTYIETVASCTSLATGSGPSGTSSPITDADCSWNYIGAQNMQNDVFIVATFPSGSQPPPSSPVLSPPQVIFTFSGNGPLQEYARGESQ